MRYVLSAMLALTLAAMPAVVNAQHPSGLPDESNQFDFWLGTWVAGGGTDKVKRIGDGVAILEKWDAGATKGWSINVFDPKTGTWTQTWHTTTGVYSQYTGKKEGDRIVLIGGTGNQLQRLSFVDITRNSFTQLYENSSDGGQTWTVTGRVPFVRVK